MSHHGAQYYLYVRWVEQPLIRCGVDLLSLPTTVATQPQVKHLLFVQPSVSLISNSFDQFFEYPRKSASLLSSAVIWCFLYIWHEFDTAIVAIFIIPFSKKKIPYLFVRRQRKNYNNTTFLLFYDCFFFNVAFLIFDIAKSAVSLSVQGLFSDICKWSKNACPTFLEKSVS